MNDEITVVISCFDYGAYLPQSVASALERQGQDEPRVIVVDDGSTDPRTLAELERLPPQVQLIRQANTGLAAARNAALAQVSTPYALILDADDVLADGALVPLRAVLEADPRLGFSYGLIRFFGAWEGDLRMPPYDPYRLLFRHNIGSTALVRMELFEDLGGYDPAFAGYEDWELWLHALARGWRGQRVERVTLLHRRHGSSRHLGARSRYRSIYRQLRRKHSDLYSRAGRRALRAQSDLSPGGRLLYRWWWGWRPLPARAELTLQALMWRQRGYAAAPPGEWA